jgi:AmpD protein
MKMRIESGWLLGEGVRRMDSPNCDSRPCTVGNQCNAVTLLVIHNISLPPGQFGGCHVDELFTNCLNPAAHPFFEHIANVKVSAHLFIDRQGNITQYVSLHDRAWHAGLSSFQGKANCNDYSIGIELEGTDDQPYTDVQYRRLAMITSLLMQEYPGIKADNIVGHCDIAPDRKTDPGASFDWAYYRRLIVACA